MAFINVAAAAAFVATACNRACKLWQLWRLASVSRINHNDFGGALVTAGGQNNSIQFAVELQLQLQSESELELEIS